MISAKKARELAMKARTKKTEIAIAYFYNEFKRFDEQIERAASIDGKTHIVLRFNTSRDSFYETPSKKREELIRNYYEKEGFVVTFNPRVSSAFSLSW